MVEWKEAINPTKKEKKLVYIMIMIYLLISLFLVVRYIDDNTDWDFLIILLFLFNAYFTISIIGIYCYVVVRRFHFEKGILYIKSKYGKVKKIHLKDASNMCVDPPERCSMIYMNKAVSISSRKEIIKDLYIMWKNSKK